MTLLQWALLFLAFVVLVVGLDVLWYYYKKSKRKKRHDMNDTINLL
jgi:hypothetical protein